MEEHVFFSQYDVFIKSDFNYKKTRSTLESNTYKLLITEKIPIQYGNINRFSDSSRKKPHFSHTQKQLHIFLLLLLTIRFTQPCHNLIISVFPTLHLLLQFLNTIPNFSPTCRSRFSITYTAHLPTPCC